MALLTWRSHINSRFVWVCFDCNAKWAQGVTESVVHAHENVASHTVIRARPPGFAIWERSWDSGLPKWSDPWGLGPER